MSFLNLEGAYENELAATGDFNPQAPRTALRLPSGQRVVLPTEVLLEALAQPHAGPPATVASAERSGAEVVGSREQQSAARRPVEDGEAMIPLVAEQIKVGKTEVETARVRVRRETQEHVETVSVPLANVNWEVEHVQINQLVEAQPEIRQVGETIVFPLVEERLVVKRELWLREEVHVRKVRSVVEKSADFPLKRDVLVEERTRVGERE